MPGSSLWLLPPKDHPLNGILTSCIQRTSGYFHSSHLFLPHITLTSNITPSTYSPDPQKWLDNLDLFGTPPTSVEVNFTHLESQDAFFKKLYISVLKEAGLIEIAKRARRVVPGEEDEAEAERWAVEEWGPHLSLLYHDCPKVSIEEIEKVKEMVLDAGLSFTWNDECSGWTGGKVVLVPTDRPIEQWEPIAAREI